MELFGIQFAPLFIPMQRRLQTLAAAAWFVTLAFGGFIGAFVAIYMLLYTRFWWLAVIYMIWIYLDRDICEQGGRMIPFTRDWAWWRYFRDYFPLKLVKVEGVELDPKKNYLFCCFPHGMLSTGAFYAFATHASEYKDLFPHHSSRVVTLTQHYIMPFFRELSLSLGGIACTAESIRYVLSIPGGGHLVVLMPGGAAEAYYCKPGQYKIILNSRKGFVKLSLKTGAPLVPVISFGETDLYEQLDGPNLRKFQEFLRKYIGMAPVIPIGRGFFQYTFGVIPQRRAITTVVGKPIEVEKDENPSNEKIESLHAKFKEALLNLFNEQKHLYLKNADKIELEIQ